MPVGEGRNAELIPREELPRSGPSSAPLSRCFRGGGGRG